MSDLTNVPDQELWAELVRRGAAIHVGYCYPAQASDPEASELIKQHGYEFGPWQLIELNHPRLAEPPQWPIFTQVPDKFRPTTPEADR